MYSCSRSSSRTDRPCYKVEVVEQAVTQGGLKPFRPLQEGKQPKCKCSAIQEFTLPDNHNAITQIFQFLQLTLVTSPVVSEFPRPEDPISSRNLPETASFVGMPVTAVHEDSPATLAVHQVWSAGQMRRVHGESEPQGTDELPQGPLDRSILLFDSRH